MAIRRMIDKRIWEDEHFGSLSDKGKLLFISCFNHADDEGRLSGNIANLKAQAFRFNDMPMPEVQGLLLELIEKMPNFKLYKIKSCDYIQFLKWTDYQTIRSDRFKPSKIPPFNMSDNQMTTKCLPTDSIDKIKVDERNKEEIKGDKSSVDADKISSDEYKFLDNLDIKANSTIVSKEAKKEAIKNALAYYTGNNENEKIARSLANSGLTKLEILHVLNEKKHNEK